MTDEPTCNCRGQHPDGWDECDICVPPPSEAEMRAELEAAGLDVDAILTRLGKTIRWLASGKSGPSTEEVDMVYEAMTGDHIPLDIILDARQDRIHQDVGRSRVARAVRKKP